MPRPVLRPSLALLLVHALACGPGAPDGDPTTSTATPGSTGTPTTTTSTGAPTTGAPGSTAAPATTTALDDTTTTAPATSTGPDDTTQSATTETTAGPCVIDPAQDICSESCDFEDCCKCNIHALPREPGAADCQIAVGVVVSRCGWSLESVLLDGQALDPFDCAGDGGGWQQFVQDGDIILELCGDACAAYLSGEYRTLETYIFCESA